MCMYVKCNGAIYMYPICAVLSDYAFYKYTKHVYSSSPFDTYYFIFFPNGNNILNVELFSHM